MSFLPSGAVNVVIAGARYRCRASQTFRVIDQSAQSDTTHDFSDLEFSLDVGDVSFYIPADVHEQLSQHSEVIAKNNREHR